MTQNGITGEMSSVNISSSSSIHNQGTDSRGARSLASDMQQRAKLLLDEIVQFQQYLKEKKREDAIYLNPFKSDVKLELKLLEKVQHSFLLSRLRLTKIAVVYGYNR
jgi:hypothetical protein